MPSAEYQREYRKNNPEKMKAYYRKSYSTAKNTAKYRRQTARLLGISSEWYAEKFKHQCGLCAVCGKPETAVHGQTGKTLSLAIDHCHKTGKVRGLLCRKCNIGIGGFGDDPILLRAAVTYLEAIY